MKRRHQNKNESFQVNELEAEEKLSLLLNCLPDAPLSENFTEQVLGKTVHAFPRKEVQPQQRSAEDVQLDKLFTMLPQVPLSQDFTEKVMAQVLVQPSRESLYRRWLGVVRSRYWVRGVAAACAVCFLVFGASLQYKELRMQEIAQSLSTVAETATEIAAVSETDLEAIAALGEISENATVDNELWLAMVTY